MEMAMPLGQVDQFHQSSRVMNMLEVVRNEDESPVTPGLRQCGVQLGEAIPNAEATVTRNIRNQERATSTYAIAQRMPNSVVARGLCDCMQHSPNEEGEREGDLAGTLYSSPKLRCKNYRVKEGSPSMH